MDDRKVARAVSCFVARLGRRATGEQAGGVTFWGRTVTCRTFVVASLDAALSWRLPQVCWNWLEEVPSPLGEVLLACSAQASRFRYQDPRELPCRCQWIDSALVARIEKLTGRPAHPFLKRGIFFAHRWEMFLGGGAGRAGRGGAGGAGRGGAGRGGAGQGGAGRGGGGLGGAGRG